MTRTCTTGPHERNYLLNTTLSVVYFTGQHLTITINSCYNIRHKCHTWVTFLFQKKKKRLVFHPQKIFPVAPALFLATQILCRGENPQRKGTENPVKLNLDVKTSHFPLRVFFPCRFLSIWENNAQTKTFKHNRSIWRIDSRPRGTLLLLLLLLLSLPLSLMCVALFYFRIQQFVSDI